jgi:hypothetical protein
MVGTRCIRTGNDATLLRHREALTCFPYISTARQILASCFAQRNMRSGLVPERWDAFDDLMDGRPSKEGRKGTVKRIDRDRHQYRFGHQP